MTSAAFSAIGWGAIAHLAALTILAIQASLGARALSWLGLADEIRTHERILFGWAAGFSLSTLACMLLASAGALGPISVSLLLLAMTAASWPAPREIISDCVRVIRTVDVGTRLAVAFGIAALTLWTAPLLVQTLLPNSDWDSALYHLPLAERYLSGSLWGSTESAAYFPAFAFPGAVHFVYAQLLALGLEAAIVPLNYWVIALLVFTTVAVGRRIGGRNGSIWAAVLFATTPILWQLGVDPRVESFLCLTVLLGAYAVVGFVQNGRDLHLKLAAVALGAAVGCKYTALPFAAAMLAVGIAFRVWGSAGTRGLAGLLAGMTLLLAIPNAAWYAANAARHGDPLFPMLRGNYIATPGGERIHLDRADSEEDPTHLEDPEVRARLAQLNRAPRSESRGNLFNLLELVRDPDRYAVKPHHGIGALLLLSLALPLVLPYHPERRRGALVMWLFGWGGFALLGSQTNLLRYVAPALPMLAATGGVFVARVPLRSLRIAIGLAAVALLARDFQAEQQKLALLLPETALGSPSAWQDDDVRLEWLKQVGYNFTPPVAFAISHINAMLQDGRMPEDSRILMIGEGKGRLLDCEWVPDSSWFAHRFVAELRSASLDHEALAEQLRSQGVTHVLYNPRYYDWVMTGTDTARSRLAFALTHVERFLGRHGTRIYQGGGIQLVDIRAERAR